MTAWLPFISVLVLIIIASSIAITLLNRADQALRRRERVIR